MVRTTFGCTHALAVARFADEARDRRLVLAQLLAQDFHGDDAVRRVLGAKNRGRSTLADFVAEGVASERLSQQVFFWHGANLTPIRGRSQAIPFRRVPKCARRMWRAAAIS